MLSHAHRCFAFLPWQSCALEEPSAAAFLHQNYPDYFGEIEDLADAANFLSDASALAEAQRRHPWQTPLLPYVASLAGRSVITHNRHPAPSRRSQIRKPQLFAVEREAVERARRAVAAFRSGLDFDLRLRGAGELASDLLPFLRLLMRQTSTARFAELPRLSDEQFNAMVELTTYGAAPPPPRIKLETFASCSREESAGSSLRGASTEHAPPFDDDIEE